MFAEQIDTITAQLEKPNEYPHPIIYRSLIDPQLYKGKPTPSRASLLEEAIALVVAGTDTTGIELKEAWSNLADRPRCEVLEKLPHLRIAPTTTPENSRMVPPQGTTIGGKFIPGTTIVSMGVLFPMKHSDAFENPTKCEPERWLENTHTLDNLAWCELYLAFANLFRRFDLSLDGTK
ncbi:PAH-inducible cytochrome P450 monooxygenase PC-PAH 5 [Drepanopeziza brunnea f. sp. 'multigermtubi' MB_m1]|uniref:PAH-inducible cytochrome P450 monooxygenase PC-PAH 5 n=1 Tax=Marssonina brunnea f. sp. multigermtubi (strain MB_m1) TaxID=1072389 RepID=K1XDE9_MARBU|nr:PAH-inducible cytochrome P450 monooxygenase PC-PAH 5 [Drepanopeziza brunnea f. sp. 'multigermtubi' MB_m1]EKD18898.1 PAH-inducible cytochrome P450 monooxygenase PC-PAH 5 [Drepanopeziza brunnea f. sp. 'multigermtubi' MB_m1]